MKVEVKMDGTERKGGSKEEGRKRDKQGRNKEQLPSRFTVYVI